jgi:hypothetical protein
MSVILLNDREDQRLRVLRYLKQHMPAFGAECLKIRDMAGRMAPLELNAAQLYAHQVCEEQKADTGMVRVIVLKGRKQGLSTYFGGRFYHQASMSEGMKARVLAHVQDSSDELFGMVKRFHECNPFAPSTRNSNAKELVFAALDGGYKVNTAGSEDIGRGGTSQLLHCSEFAFWKNSFAQYAAISNIVADVEGTEVALESTANGYGNAFAEVWSQAEAGQGMFRTIFIPWFWEKRYQANVPHDFHLTEIEARYADAHGLSLGQMAWRRNKMAGYDDGHQWLFDQEFPATPSHAFQVPNANPLISPDLVAAAVNSDYRSMSGAKVIGCDPAEYGDDRTAIVCRHGRTVYRVEYHAKKGPMEVAGILANLWQTESPDGLLVDRGGIGSGIVDRLKELNIPVIGVMAGASAQDKEQFKNKRAEMWWRTKYWLEETPCRLPRDAALMSDLSAPSYSYDSSGRKQLEKKDDMKKRGARSPDGGDALAMTFAEPVVPRALRDERSLHSHGHAAATSAGY